MPSNPSPAPLFVATLFLWLFAWEIGGQNIPNDWTDIEEDRRFNAQTIPIRLGLPRSALIIVGCLVAALFLNIAILWVSPLTFGPVHMIAAVGINLLLLLHPAFVLGEQGPGRPGHGALQQSQLLPPGQPGPGPAAHGLRGLSPATFPWGIEITST